MRIAILLAMAALLVPAYVYAAPGNDGFVSAQDLTAIGESRGSVELANVGATKEVGEPAHAGNSGGRSVWYEWTAPADGSVPHVAFTLGSANFDTLLGVYTGASVDTLTEVASNDDNPGAEDGSVVSFATTPGTQYSLAVDGFAGKFGRAFISWQPAPANDNFAGAIELTDGAGSRSGDRMAGATVEAGERDFLYGAGATIWYSWSPLADGTYRFSTLGTRFDSVLTVYEGTDLDSLVRVGINDDDPDLGCCSSWVPIVGASASKTYMIRVSPYGGDSTTRRVTLHWSPLVLGTSAADTLAGSVGGEEIRGRGGDDTIEAGDGDDIVLGGRGNDTLSGMVGNDRLFGGRGNDLLVGAAGADLLVDQQGRDVLRGGADADELNTRDGRAGDLLVGGPGPDNCRSDSDDTRRTCP